MGREIRRVPAGWNHPKDSAGQYKPLYDKTYKEAADEWMAEFAAWHAGTSEDAKKHKSEIPYYWDWGGNPPDRNYYRPDFGAEATHYQVYQTVSEGTPTSPVFASLDEMRVWLLAGGHSERAADAFIKCEWAPSMIMSAGKMYGPGIDSHDTPMKGDSDADH